jgi:hypothetical protein
MSDEIILHHNPMSRGRIAHLMLEEVGAPYRIVVPSRSTRWGRSRPSSTVASS